MTNDPDQAHNGPRVRRVVRRRRDDQHGVILVWMAFSLVALLMFAGFMVDLGAWYQQSQDLQRTVDAAALAGATYLPNSPGSGGANLVPAQATGAPSNCPATWLTTGVSDATCAALKTIYKNGYPNARVNISVDGSNDRQLDISITNGGNQYFTSFFMGPVTFTRSSHAQFSQPIDLGSPQNYYGMGTLLGYTGFSSGSTPNFWASISGYCEGKESGDEYAAGFDGNVASVHNGTYTLASSPFNCDPTNDTRISTTPTACNTGQSENCEFDPAGYSYVINVPSGLPGNAAYVYIFNAKYDPCMNQPAYSGTNLIAAPSPPYTNPLMDSDSNLSTEYPCGGSQPGGATQIYTYYTLIGPNGAVGSTGQGAGVYRASTQWTAGYPSWTNLTSKLGQNSGLTPGTYYLNVSTLKVTYNSGLNEVQPVAASQDALPSFGVHNYGIMVSSNSSTPSVNLNDGATYVCTGSPCPTVYANTSTAEAATIVSPGGNSTATAYLANVPTEAVGKLVTLKLWDVGDFAQYIQIIKPDQAVLGTETGDPTINYVVTGADPDAPSVWPGNVVPNPNNTAPVASGTLAATCTDPFSSPAGQAFTENPTGPCFPVDGCTTDPGGQSYVGNNPPLTACANDLPDIGGANWGAPHNRFGPSRYSDSLVELSFIAPTSGWYGIAETTGAAQVHDTITLNLLINGLPPHLTP